MKIIRRDEQTLQRAVIDQLAVRAAGRRRASLPSIPPTEARDRRSRRRP
jgi:hypothetical protein